MNGAQHKTHKGQSLKATMFAEKSSPVLTMAVGAVMHAIVAMTVIAGNME